MLLKNIISVVVASLISGLATFLMAIFFSVSPRHWYYSVIFWAVLCFAFNYICVKRLKSSLFNHILLYGYSFKMVLAMMGIFVYYLFDSAGYKHFAFHFLAHYFVFTIIEIMFLVKLVKSVRPA